uniref:Tyr recombinase domain-containing protein n=1 Tax=Panagrellus redivivus TaxID=6233 RepID=A0A7E4V1Y6_PANRE
MDTSFAARELALVLPEPEASALASRIMKSVRASSTLAVYAPVIKQYELFRGTSVVPHRATVFAFLAKYYLGKASFRTAAAALRLYFVSKSVNPNPLDSEVVSLLRAAAEREKPQPVNRTKWSTAQLLDLVKILKQDGSTPNRRLRVVLLVTFAGFMRPAEAVALRVEDVSFVDGRMNLRIVKTKTNQNGPAQRAIVDPIPEDEACPVQAVRQWIDDTARKGSEWLFPNLNRPSQHVKADLIQSSLRHLKAKGLIPQGYTLHGLRGGATQACIEAGIPIDAVQRAGRWTRTDSMRPYIAASRRSLRGTTNAIGAGMQLIPQHPSSNDRQPSST